MDKLKTANKALIFLYIAVFPLGQIPGQIFDFFLPNTPTIHIADLIILLIAALNLKYIKNIKILLFILMFSLLINLPFFGTNSLLGALYLIRFTSFIIFGFVVFNNYKTKIQKNNLLNSLLIISAVVAVVGLIQLWLLPDTRFLKLLNWDDHYGRLISTFLDPAFTGIILVFGFLISLSKTLKKFNYKYFILLIILFISIGLTYSRASFLALVFSSLYLIFKNKFSYKFLTIFIFLIFASILMLPRSFSSEGVKLERLHSVYAKVDDRMEGLAVFSKNPLFGVGFGNICAVKSGYSQNGIFSHSCSAFDNIFIMILSTTGVIGLLIFLYYIYKLYKTRSQDIFGEIWTSSMIALLVHGSFTNTLFYPWVLGWMGIVTAISTKNLRIKMKN